MSYAQPSPPTIHTLRLDQHVGQADQVARRGRVVANARAILELGDALPLRRRCPSASTGRRSSSVVGEIRAD